MLYSLLKPLRSPLFASVAFVLVTAISVGVWFYLAAPKSNQTIIEYKTEQLGSQPSQTNPPDEFPHNPQMVIRNAAALRKQGRDIEAFAELNLLSNHEPTSATSSSKRSNVLMFLTLRHSLPIGQRCDASCAAKEKLLRSESRQDFRLHRLNDRNS